MGDDVLLIYLIIGVILIFVVLGILIWAVVSMIKKSGAQDNAKEPSRRATENSSSQNAAKLADSPSTEQEPQSPAMSETKDSELLRVYREGATGAIYVEIEGKQYHRLTDIHDPTTGRLLLQAVAELGRFTRGVTPAVPAKSLAAPSTKQKTGSTSLLKSQQAETSPGAQDTSRPPVPGSLAKRGEALMGNSQSKAEPVPPSPASGLLERASKISNGGEPASKGPSPEPKRPPVTGVPKKPEQRISMGAFWGRMLSSPGSNLESPGPRPLADELEDSLRDIIDKAPEEIPREIHFRTASDGGLLIEVDGVCYQGLAEINDPLAKQIIQTVIARWEKR